MIYSIRRFLLLNLLISITLTTIISTLGALYLDKRDIQNYFDKQLIQMALTFQALIAQDLSDDSIDKVQAQVDGIPNLMSRYMSQHGVEDIVELNSNIQYQVWKGDRLILHSPNSLDIPLSASPFGISFKEYSNTQWRVFSLYNPETDYHVLVAQRYELWQHLQTNIAKDDAFIVLTIYPLLGVIIWLIVSWGLRPIRKIAYFVSHRDPQNLHRFEIKTVPTELQPLIDELNYLFNRLEQAFEREKRFTADAAHELKTPLTILKTHAQLALNSTNEQQRQQALNNLLAGVNRSAHIIDQLLLLSRSEPEAQRNIPVTIFDLKKVLVDTISALSGLALDKNIELEFRSPVEGPVWLEGREITIQVLIRNLIDNAIRYTPENGKVISTLKVTDKATILRVIDTGPGIAPELHKQVFSRFYRVLGTKSTGSGLGLAIVQQIADLHGAKIKLKSPLYTGGGLAFSVIFYHQLTLPVPQH